MSKSEEAEMEIYQQIRSLDARSQEVIYKNISCLKRNMVAYGKRLAGIEDAYGSKKKTNDLETEIYKLISKLDARQQNIIKSNIKQIKFGFTYFGRKIAYEK